MSPDNLLGEPPPTLLPTDPATAPLAAGTPPADVARDNPESSLAWAILAEDSLRQGADLQGYAYARVGYHRGLDALRRHGWRGFGLVPWSHQPNRGFLRAVAALAEAADRIGETPEADRCRALLADCDPDASPSVN